MLLLLLFAFLVLVLVQCVKGLCLWAVGNRTPTAVGDAEQPSVCRPCPGLVLPGIIIIFALKLLNTMIMEKSLLQVFLGQHPESLHPADRQRFVDYVFECWKNGTDVDYNTLGALPQEVQQQLTDAVVWIELALDKLKGMRG